MLAAMPDFSRSLRFIAPHPEHSIVRNSKPFSLVLVLHSLPKWFSPPQLEICGGLLYLISRCCRITALRWGRELRPDSALPTASRVRRASSRALRLASGAFRRAPARLP